MTSLWLVTLTAILLVGPVNLRSQDATSNANIPKQEPKIELPDIDTGPQSAMKASALLFKPGVTFEIRGGKAEQASFGLSSNGAEVKYYDTQGASLYNIVSGALLRNISRPRECLLGPGHAVVYSDDLEIAACSTPKETAIYEVNSGRKLGQLDGTQDDGKRAIYFVPQRIFKNNRLISEGKWTREGNGFALSRVQFWSLPELKLLGSIDNPPLPNGGSVCPASGTYCAFPEKSGSIKLYEVPSGKLVAVLEGHAGPVFHSSFSSDDKLFCSASFDGTIRVWDLTKQVFVKTIPLPVQVGKFKTAALGVSPDKHYIAFSADARAWLIEVQSGQVVQVIADYSSVPSFVFGAISFSGDGNSIFAAAGEGVVRTYQRVGSPDSENAVQGQFKIVK